MSGRSHATVMNGKRLSSVPGRHQQNPSNTSSHHFDLIKYIFDSWNAVTKEVECPHGILTYRPARAAYYKDGEPNPQMKDFEPFDLEAWWGQRVMQSITRNANS